MTVAGLLEQGAKWLKGMRASHTSKCVVYGRGLDFAEVPATVGRTVFRLDKGYGITERIESRDYLILASDLKLNGAAILPKAGDIIRETDGGKVFVHELVSPGGESCWRWSDPWRRTLRTHTKQVGVEDL